jgi:hypothetical protein
MLTIRIAVAIVGLVQIATTYYLWILYSRVLPIIVKHANLTRSAAERIRTITRKISELQDRIQTLEEVARGTGVSKSLVRPTLEEQGLDENLAKVARGAERRSYAVETTGGPNLVRRTIPHSVPCLETIRPTRPPYSPARPLKARSIALRRRRRPDHWPHFCGGVTQG